MGEQNGGYAIQSEMDGAYLSVGSSGCSGGYGDRADGWPEQPIRPLRGVEPPGDEL